MPSTRARAVVAVGLAVNQSESRMREIRTSGLMSGDGKRGVRMEPPRPSSTLQVKGRKRQVMVGHGVGDTRYVRVPKKQLLQLRQGLPSARRIRVTWPGARVTFFPNEERYTSMVMEKDIPFYSLCSHHFVPFYGHAHVAYIPNESIVGLSKMARIVEFYARRPSSRSG